MSHRKTVMEATSITSGRDPRSDLLYHFYAYHYFAPQATALDLINLTDADVNFYNLIADVIRGSNSHYKLAAYLKTYHDCVSYSEPHSKPPTARMIGSTNDRAFREEFISHIKHYNKTVKPRNRFYIIGLAECDMEYLLSFDQKNGKESQSFRMATDACCDVEIPYLCRRSFEGDGTVEGTMEDTMKKCLADSSDKLKVDAILDAKIGQLRLASADNVGQH